MSLNIFVYSSFFSFKVIFIHNEIYKSSVLLNASSILKPLRKVCNMTITRESFVMPFPCQSIPLPPASDATIALFFILLWISFACSQIVYYRIIEHVLLCVRLLLLRMLLLRFDHVALAIIYSFSLLSTTVPLFQHSLVCLLISVGSFWFLCLFFIHHC